MRLSGSFSHLQHESGKMDWNRSLHLVLSMSQLQSLITSITFISPLSALLRSFSHSLCPPLNHSFTSPHHHAVTRNQEACGESYVTTAAVLSGLGWWWLVGAGGSFSKCIPLLCSTATFFMFALGYLFVLYDLTRIAAWIQRLVVHVWELAFPTWITGNRSKQ